MSQQSAAVRVLVVDDHPLYRYAIEHALDGCSWCAGVATAGDVPSACVHMRIRAPDVILLDLDLAGVDGLDVVASASSLACRAQILVLSASVSAASVNRALRAGVSGYLTKDARADEIRDAVLATARGEAVFSSSVQRELRVAFRNEAAAATVLTPRERSVLVLAAEGYKRDQIAAELQLSSSTIKAHLASTYRKLGVGDKAAAVAVAMRHGLLNSPTHDAVMPALQPDESPVRMA